MGAAERMSFLEWLRHRNDVFWSFGVNANSRNPERWSGDDHDPNVYTWRPGQPGEKVYDFNPFFPTADGRTHLDDPLEGYVYALYEHRGGTGEFVPRPDPENDDDA